MRLKVCHACVSAPAVSLVAAISRDMISLCANPVHLSTGSLLHRFLCRYEQIRMTALSLGHPVMGDSLYGTEEGKSKSDRLLLHARRISFPHVSMPHE